MSRGSTGVAARATAAPAVEQFPVDNLCPNRAASLVQLRPSFATAATGCV